MFKNSYERNKDVVREMYKYFCFQRKSRIIMFVFYGLFFIYGTVLKIYFSSNSSSSTILLVLPPLVIGFICLSYFLNVKALLNRDKEIYGKYPTLETIVIDNEKFIHAISPKDDSPQIEFCKIRCAIVTKNLIILHSKANLIYALKKDSFTEGNAEGFILFLKNLGIKVKGKQK